MTSRQDPAVLWNVVRKNSSFKVKRNGVVRSRDSLSSTGKFLREDGLFASPQTKPIAFRPGYQYMKKERKIIVLVSERDENGRVVQTPLSKINPTTIERLVRLSTRRGRHAQHSIAKGKKLVRAIKKHSSHMKTVVQKMEKRKGEK